MNNELEGCVIDFNQIKSHLEEIEFKLATDLNIKSNTRQSLIELDIGDKLPNNELVEDWRATYSSFLESENFRHSVLSFRDEIKSSSTEDNAAYQKIIKRALTYINSDDLRHALDIPKPTLLSWTSGYHLPFPLIRKSVFKIIIEKLEALV